jgi:hypothetical protein
MKKAALLKVDVVVAERGLAAKQAEVAQRVQEQVEVRATGVAVQRAQQLARRT